MMTPKEGSKKARVISLTLAGHTTIMIHAHENRTGPLMETHRELFLPFDDFVRHGQIAFPWCSELSQVVSQLPDAKICPIDDESCGVFCQEVELLFWRQQLCLVQYELSRLGAFSFGGQMLTENSTVEMISAELQAIGMRYDLGVYHESQLLLTTETGVGFYFDAPTKRFLTAMKTWAGC